MNFQVATELDINKCSNHIRYIQIDIDGGKSFCYRGRVSFNAFAHGSKHRNYNAKKGFHYYFQSLDTFLIYHNSTRNFFNNVLGKEYCQDIPILTVSSLWEFYKLVGYDYKKKKWLI